MASNGKGNVYGRKIFTKKKRNSPNDSGKIVGVIEGPADKMITAYPKEFAFMRHETKRSLRNKKLNDN